MPLVSARSLCGRLLDPLLVSSVQAVAREYAPVLRAHPTIDLARVQAATSMSEFDDAAIAPMCDLNQCSPVSVCHAGPRAAVCCEHQTRVTLQPLWQV